MKRVFVVFFILFAVSFAFVSCGGNEDEKTNPVTEEKEDGDAEETEIKEESETKEEEEINEETVTQEETETEEESKDGSGCRTKVTFQDKVTADSCTNTATTKDMCEGGNTEASGQSIISTFYDDGCPEDDLFGICSYSDGKLIVYYYTIPDNSMTESSCTSQGGEWEKK